MLVDDPQAFGVDRQDERVTNLAQRLERGQGGGEIARNFGFVGYGRCASVFGSRAGQRFGRANQRQGRVTLDRNAFSELEALTDGRRSWGLQAERLRSRSVERAPGGVGRGIAASPERGAGTGAGADLDRELRHRARLHERGADRFADEIVHHTRLPKTDFGLRGMYVDVDFARGQIEKQQHHRKNRGRQDVAISLDDGVLDEAVADQTPVDEYVNRIAIQLLNFGFGDETVHPEFSEVRGFIFGVVFALLRFADGGTRAALAFRSPAPGRRLGQSDAFERLHRGEIG